MFEYSTKKIPATNVPKIANEVYHKIKKTGYFMSPYTLRKCQLKENVFASSNDSVFDHASIFRYRHLKIGLGGRGQYFQNGLSASEVSDQQLNTHYYQDTTLTTENRLENVKFVHLERKIVRCWCSFFEFYRCFIMTSFSVSKYIVVLLMLGNFPVLGSLRR